MIIIASDKFKGTFTAGEICRLIGDKVRRSYPEEEIKLIPMADGGEGTARVIAIRRGLTKRGIRGVNPFGKAVEWRFYSDGEIAAVDSAAIVGREAVGKVVAPLMASSYPLGKFVDTLSAQGINHLYIGVGGTMTTDGGAGFLQALGWRFLMSSGDIVTGHLSPRMLPTIVKVIPPERMSEMKISALMDTDVAFVPDGDSKGLSTLSFARQKGVKDDEMSLLREALSKFYRVVSETMNQENMPSHYCGAGGGLGFALQIAGAEALPGALTVWRQAIAGSGIRPENIRRIYTGEGCLDIQSLCGKVTGTIMDYGSHNNIPVTVVCGRCELPAGAVRAGVDVSLLSDFI